MASIEARVKKLLKQRTDDEPTGLIIGTTSGYMVFVFGLEPQKNFPDFSTVQEVRDALTACGITKIGIIGGD